MISASDLFDDEGDDLLKKLDMLKSIRISIEKGNHIYMLISSTEVGKKVFEQMVEKTQPICLEIVDAEYKAIKKEYRDLMESRIND